ncbi:MAG: heavy metal translocating P-type ATPase [Candidatus Binatia bacterium]
MTCANCVGRVERALSKVPGVLEVSVNLALERASVRYEPEALDSAGVLAAIEEAGYAAVDLATAEEQLGEDEQRQLQGSLRLALIFTLPLVLVSMGPMLWPGLMEWKGELAPTLFWSFLELSLASLVLFGPGRRFLRPAIAELRHKSPGMNTLIMMGSMSAWIYSTLVVILPDIFPAGTANLYFEAAAVIITLILLGKLMEARAKGRTSEAIKRLLQLRPATARVARDGVFVEVAIEEVVAGDRVQLRPGDRIPVDGVVEEGSSWVDESMISGEALPVAKEKGSELVGGTINQNGALVFQATRVGADTVLARIIQMVEDAQAGKPPIQELADRIASVFVPLVLVAAVVTFATWLLVGPAPALNHAFVAAVSVLVIACPCAMGLATPTAIMVGTGKAAEMGALFRKGVAIESLGRVRRVVLDKTGTLTKGQPELTDLLVLEGDERELLALAAAAEDQSEHPIARAIVRAARERGLSWTRHQSFEALPGYGLSATVGGQELHIGADRYMKRLGVDVSRLKERAEELADQARTTVFMARDGRLAALLGVADPIKDGSVEALSRLRKLGIRMTMLSGDNRRTAEAVARELGIDEVVAELLPDQKAEQVASFQSSGEQVAFVGDGINDAPALARAQVGIAIGTGTDIAIESADLILMSGDLRVLADALALSRRTLRTIRGNFLWAYAYNVALIPVAAGLLYPVFELLLNPMLAAAAMSFSSVFVVTNSLRLRRFQRPARN